MAEENTCQHEICGCHVGDDDEYCSPHCESAAEQELTEMKCECGHAGCGG